MKTKAADAGSIPPMKVIWSALHAGERSEEHLHRVIDRAAAEKVSGVELSGRAIDDYISYRQFPKLAQCADAEAVERSQGFLHRILDHAAEKGLRFGLWHHEISGPANLLELVPELRAADGLMDLESPVLYEFIRARVSEFFSIFPRVDEMVLTMTETSFPIFQRPFCPAPVPERVRRLLQALLDVLEPLGKILVVRPSSAVREDELHVRAAVEKLKARNLVMMYKTEPFDWHPFLQDEPLIGSIPRHPCRAETDAGAEYYGQTVFPCSYTGHIASRLGAAATRGARTAVIRVDRGAHHAALGHPINEANVIAPTRWAMDPTRPIEDFWREWCAERHGFESHELHEVLERTFEVIKKSLYIDRHAFTHDLFPDLGGAKHVQAFGLLEEDIPLDHMKRNWGVLSDRRTPTHEQALAEKNEALAFAIGIVSDFDFAAAGMPAASRKAVRASLENLPLLALACLGFTRVAIAHLEEVRKRPVRATDSFERESRRFLELAERIDRERGPHFWLSMTERMRDVAQGLAHERALEMPLRAQIESRADVLDYVLCGFASEGHRLGKILHSGRTDEFRGRYIRATGAGPEQGFSYRLKSPGASARKAALTFAGEGGYDAPAVVRIGGNEHSVAVGPLDGFKTMIFDVPNGQGPEIEVAVESATLQPVQVAEILLLA